MGIWGAELYQNDTSLDVRDQFETLLDNGKTAQEITLQLVQNFKGTIGDIDEEPLFWLALADTQWNWGVLLPSVQEKALHWLAKARNVPKGLPTSKENEEQWRRVLDDLRAKLLSPQPLVKEAAQKKVYKCEWKIGDVFAYQLESDLAKERGFYGRYFLIQKVDEGKWYPGHIVPIVYVKLTKGAVLPTAVAEYDKLEYVQTWFTRYENRFWPVDMSRLQEDLAEKSKMHYEVDEYGFLPEYRVTLLNTSKRVIPKKLIYVGNFRNAAPPDKEFVPHVKENIGSVFWKRLNETFETIMIKKYCNHNLRELSIYSR